MNKLILSIIIALLLGGPSQASQISKDEALSAFSKGNFAYQDDMYDDAVTDYESIIKGGWESGPVYYNLANSYVKKGEIGKAVLNYERALKFMPRDPDLKANYTYALSLSKKNIVDTRRKSFINQEVNKAIDRFTYNELGLMALALVAALLLFHIISLYFNRSKARSGMVFSILALMLVAVCAGLFIKHENEAGSAIVISDTQSKFEPREEATTHFELFEGNKVKVLRQDGMWAKIRRFDGKEGWVDSEAIENI